MNSEKLSSYIKPQQAYSHSSKEVTKRCVHSLNMLPQPAAAERSESALETQDCDQPFLNFDADVVAFRTDGAHTTQQVYNIQRQTL